jgi:hypothetical protein
LSWPLFEIENTKSDGAAISLHRTEAGQVIDGSAGKIPHRQCRPPKIDSRGGRGPEVRRIRPMERVISLM